MRFTLNVKKNLFLKNNLIKDINDVLYKKHLAFNPVSNKLLIFI